jgi:hypothetical protein
MHASARSGRLSVARLLVLLVAASALLAAATAGCGGDGDDGSESPSTSVLPSAATSADGKPDFTNPSSSPLLERVTRLDVDGDLLVVRDTRRPAIWRVTPKTGADGLVAGLPSWPNEASVSPDSRQVAYRVETKSGSLRSMVCVLDVAAESIEIYRTPATGLWDVGGMAWLSSTELLLSGPPTRAARSRSSASDVLRVLDLHAGQAGSFPSETGMIPSAALDAEAVVFERLTELGKEQDETVVREELMRADMRSGDETVLLSEDYTQYAAGRRFSSPFASPDARFVLTSQTGSDTGVVWRLWRTDDGAQVWRKQTSMAFPLSAAWDAGGRRIACWGMSPSAPARTFVWVYDVHTGTPTRSADLGQGVMVGGLDWSKNGDLATGSFPYDYPAPRWIVTVAPGGDVSRLVPLCEGALPVWLD